MKHSPSVGKIMSDRSFSVVVFPAPLGPRKPTHFAPDIFRSREDRAVKLPNLFVRCRVSMEGTLMGDPRPGHPGPLSKPLRQFRSEGKSSACIDYPSIRNYI
jgi:hypothetical protein